jgi:hypothetical protein
MPHPATARNVRGYLYGDLGRDPIALELLVVFVGGHVTPERLPAALDGIEADLKRQPNVRWKLEGPMRRKTIGRWQALTFTYRDPMGIRRQGWATVLGNRQVVLTLYSRKDTPPQWTRLGEELFHSLRDETP